MPAATRFFPAVFSPINFIPQEHDPLVFEQLFLPLIGMSTFLKRDLAPGIDHPVPWDFDVVREIVKSISDEPGLAAQTTKCRDLTVACDLASRNFTDGLPDEMIR